MFTGAFLDLIHYFYSKNTRAAHEQVDLNNFEQDYFSSRSSAQCT